jgi:hypothetical protein
VRRTLAAKPGGAARRGKRAIAAPALLAALLLASCNAAAPEPEPEQTEVPEELSRAPAPAATAEVESLGTPLAERVATLGLLNKRNNIARDIEVSPGQSRRVGDVVVRLASCERTAPWESPPETGAFVQVFVEDRPQAGADGRWLRVFSGWLFKNSPGLNVVEHPVYDVWVKDCAMSFPEEETPVEPDEEGGSPAPGRAAPSPPSPSPSPAPTPVTNEV